jgi:acetolactate synthase-1/2/3 large subunit
MALDNIGVDFKSTDFVSIGKAYGFHAEWVDDADHYAAELAAALQRNTTTLLACRFPQKAYDGAF